MKIRLNKINCFSIVKNHLKTLVNYNTGKTSFDDWVTFLLLPVVVSLAMFIINGTSSSYTVNLIITVLAIFVGLLINVLVLIFSLLQEENGNPIKIRLLKETISNISYTIVVSIFTIAICFFTFINCKALLIVSTILIYFFVIHFFFTLMMIVKRMYALFIDEVEQIEEMHKKDRVDDLN